MGFQDIIKKIENDANRKAEKILQGGRAEEDRLIKEAGINGQRQCNSIMEKGKIKAEERLKRMKQAADIHAMKLMLATKQEIMEKAFTGAEQALKAMPNNEYRDFLKKKVINAVVSGDEEIMIGKTDRNRLGASWIKEVNEELAKRGKERPHLKFSKTKMETNGGFILLRGNIHTNCAFLSLIKSYRDRLEPEIANILFAKEN